jgi:hypothetical protein
MQEVYWMELGGRCQKLLVSLCIFDVHQSIGSLKYVVQFASGNVSSFAQLEAIGLIEDGLML